MTKMYTVREMVEMVEMNWDEKAAYLESIIVNCDAYQEGEVLGVEFQYEDGTEAWFTNKDFPALILLDAEGRMVAIAEEGYTGWLPALKEHFLTVNLHFDKDGYNSKHFEEHEGFGVTALRKMWFPLRGQEGKEASLEGVERVVIR